MDVVVYTTPTCGYCHQAKAYLSRQGVPFVEKNVAADQAAAMEMISKSGQQGVPVITVDGEVVIGFNQPRLSQLLEKAQPKLGASIADASSQSKKHSGIPSSGAYVGRVRRGSSAERAGLRPGDVITGLAGQPIKNAQDLHRVVSEMPKMRDLSLVYVRDGRERDALVRL
jgi:glutaredoxin-like YruB-family protein